MPCKPKFYFYKGESIMGNNTTPKCSCVNCNNLGKYAYPARRRGGNNAYLCSFHRTSLDSYYSENNLFVGKPKANGITISHELEVMKPTEYARLELCLQGYLPTHDSTVDAEFKSAISYGLNTISSYADTIEYLRNSGEIVLDGNVGLHTHFGHTLINSVTMAYIRRFYHSLFIPTMTAWKNNPEKYTTLFGRKAGGWACCVTDMNSVPVEHTNAVNVQHEPTIEFRSPRFQTAKQYIAVVNYLKKVVLAVVETYIPALIEAGLITIDENGKPVAIGDIGGKKISDSWDSFNAGITTLNTEQRKLLKEAADKTSKKLVKMWESLDVSDIHWTGNIGDAYTAIQFEC